jgi:hypothetical protein
LAQVGAQPTHVERRGHPLGTPQVSQLCPQLDAFPWGLHHARQRLAAGEQPSQATAFLFDPVKRPDQVGLPRGHGSGRRGVARQRPRDRLLDHGRRRNVAL